MWATMVEHWAFNLQKEMDTAVNRKDLGIPVGDTLFGKTVWSWCIHHCIFDLHSRGKYRHSCSCSYLCCVGPYPWIWGHWR